MLGINGDVNFDLINKHVRNYWIENIMINANVEEKKATEVYDYIINGVKSATKIEDIVKFVENNLEEIKKIIGDNNE